MSYDEFKERWPHMFENVYCGFSLPGGWHNIVWELCEDLEKEFGEDCVKVDQVKEKFGGLRFYCHFNDDLVYDDISSIQNRITIAENISMQTCQDCSSQKNVSRKSINMWLSSLCDTCRGLRTKNHLQQND